MASNFAALWHTQLKFSAKKKDQNLSITVSKFQEASSILGVGFALWKWPHLHWAYVVTVPFSLILTVFEQHRVENFFEWTRFHSSVHLSLFLFSFLLELFQQNTTVMVISTPRINITTAIPCCDPKKELYSS